MNSKPKRPQNAKKAAEILDHYRRPNEGVMDACSRIAEMLVEIGGGDKSWSGEYFLQVAHGKLQAGREFSVAIRKLHRKIKPRRPRKPGPKRVVTAFPDPEEGEAVAGLSMEERREALTRKAERKRELPGFLARRGRYS